MINLQAENSKSDIINQFYSAFSRLDAESMVSLYHDEVLFEDPAFGPLRGVHAKNMWRMLCASQKGKDFSVVFSNIKSDDTTGSARWEAKYTFSKTGRRVHNVIQAQFRFEGDKIVEHKDQFDLYRWSKQALGYNGYLIGWTPFFKRKLNQQTNMMLDRFEQKTA